MDGEFQVESVEFGAEYAKFRATPKLTNQTNNNVRKTTINHYLTIFSQKSVKMVFSNIS
jgi:hypothetical protein